MSNAIKKLRTRLFMRFNPTLYGIDLDSELVIKPHDNFKSSVGGLEYVARSGDDFIKLIILHFEDDLFLITALPIGEASKFITSTTWIARFWIIDRSLDTAIKSCIRDIERWRESQKQKEQFSLNPN